jgi:hypothetical protein
MHARFGISTVALLAGTSLFLFALALTPAIASADTIPAVSVQQLVPGVTACAAPSVLSFTPYVYNGSLDSFEVVISDKSYVALGGTIGNTSIPLQFISRWDQQGNTVRLHVDVSSTPVQGTLSVSLLMLSAQQGSGVCAGTVTFTLAGPSAPAPTSPPTTPTPAKIPARQAPATTSSSTVSAIPVITASVIESPFSGLTSSVSRICSTNQGAYELWLTLLALYFVFVTAVVFSDVPAVRDAVAISAIVVLAPLIALFALWYGTPDCRVTVWVGIASCIVALGGLVGLLQDRGSVPLLPPATTS